MTALEQLDRIIAEGTQAYPLGSKNKPSNEIVCRDGFNVSVVAGFGAYCTPRPGGFSASDADDDFEGPYTHVEVGFPSVRPEPWAEWERYAEDPGSPTGTVYGFVPVGSVRRLIESHEVSS